MALVGLGRAQGIALTIALTVVIRPLSLSVTVELSKHGAAAVKAALVPPLLCFALVGSAVGGVISLAAAPAVLLAGLWAFGVAALLFLATLELLVEARETADTPMLATLLSVGFLALYALNAIR